MDRSLEAISPKDVAFPTPREELLSESISNGEKSCRYIRPKKDKDEPRREKEPWTTDDENFRWYVDPEQIYIQSRSVESRSPVDNDENFYYKIPEQDMQSEDEDRKRKRSSSTYKRKSVDH